jgi:hypothetical protein
VIRLTTQQQQQQPEQQQDWRSYTQILKALRAIPAMWEVATRACPAMTRTTIPAALPLLQQLQRCGQLLPAAVEAAPSHSSSSSSRYTGSDMQPHQGFFRVQYNVWRFLAALVNYVYAQQMATGIDP